MLVGNTSGWRRFSCSTAVKHCRTIRSRSCQNRAHGAAPTLERLVCNCHRTDRRRASRSDRGRLGFVGNALRCDQGRDGLRFLQDRTSATHQQSAQTCASSRSRELKRTTPCRKYLPQITVASLRFASRCENSPDGRGGGRGLAAVRCDCAAWHRYHSFGACFVPLGGFHAARVGCSRRRCRVVERRGCSAELIAHVFAMRRFPLPLILSSMFGMPNIEEA